MDVCDALPLGMARQFHTCTHTTFAPTMISGGTKTNVIADPVDLDLDVRTLPGQGDAVVRRCSTTHSATSAPKVEVLAPRRPLDRVPMDTPL